MIRVPLPESEFIFVPHDLLCDYGGFRAPVVLERDSDLADMADVAVVFHGGGVEEFSSRFKWPKAIALHPLRGVIQNFFIAFCPFHQCLRVLTELGDLTWLQAELS